MNTKPTFFLLLAIRVCELLVIFGILAVLAAFLGGKL